MVVQESQQRRMEGPPSGPQRTPSGPQQPPGLQHHHALQTPMSSHMSQPPMSGQHGARPGLERANTFPTPPASASSIMGVPNQGSSYEWGNQVPPTQPLSIDTSLSNQRSMPTTPATTPPGSNMQGLPSYQPQSYDSSKPYYSAAPQSHPQYAPHTPLTQSGMPSYGQSMPSTYMKSEMAPPNPRPGASEPDSAERNPDRYQPEEHDQEYIPTQGYNSNRSSYTYTNNPSVANLTEHAQLTPEMTSSPSQQNGSGRMTPRTSGSQPHWASGYNTPPRPAAATTLYNAVSDTRGTPATGPSDPYMASAAPVYAATNSLSAGSKRMRDEEDSVHPETATEYETSKRRKTITDDTLGGPVRGPPILQPMKPSSIMARHR